MVTVRMRDTFGRIIAEENSYGKTVRFSSEGLMPGLYFVEIPNINGTYTIEKVVIQ